jgi:subtilase family serine protease
MGIEGRGQTIAIVGGSDIYLSDIESFRGLFNLPFNDPSTILVPGTDYPGIVPDDLDEADPDIEWAGALARNAKIVYV